jgi:hypothetical protein
MKININPELIIKAIEATGALLTGIIALISVPKLVKNTMFKEEKYIGNEAIERYEVIKSKLTDEKLYTYTLENSKIKPPKLEIKKMFYDPKTMCENWKGCIKTIRFYDYEDKEKKLVKVEVYYLKKDKATMPNIILRKK